MKVSSTAAKPTCVVADDHPPVLESVSRFLELQGFRVVGRARNGEEAIALVESQRPSVAVLDLRMPLVGGTAVIRHVARTTPQCSCLVYSGFGDGALLTDALDAGARGFVLKDAPLDELVRALETVGTGGVAIDPALADILIRSTPARELGPGSGPRPETCSASSPTATRDESIGREALHLARHPARGRLLSARPWPKLGVSTRTQAVAAAHTG